MSERFIGRQPIIDSKAKIIAYDLLYRESGHHDHNGITASVISNLLGAFGTETTLGKHIGFIRVDGKFLEYDVIHSLPKEKIVFAFLSNVDMSDTDFKRLRELRLQGYRFALNDCIYTKESAKYYEELFPMLSFFKIDVSCSDLALVEQDMPMLRRYGVELVGTKIETHDMYDLCRSMGFDYFQGYFISEPNIIKNATFLPEQEGIFQLWNLLQNDTEISELVEAFQNHHTISLKLLRFINSAAFSLRNPVSSIGHVLTLMGRDPISRWIMLMMFSEGKSETTQRVPLLLMVISRTEMMSALVSVIYMKSSKNDISIAYFTGMLSLIHLLFHMPQRDVLAKLNIAPEIEKAVLDGEGLYGELLDFVRSIEMFDTESIEAFLRTKGLKYSTIEPVIQQVMEKVNQFEKAMEE